MSGYVSTWDADEDGIVDVVVDVVVVAAAKLAAVLAGASPAGGACPVATVVIPAAGRVTDPSKARK